MQVFQREDRDIRLVAAADEPAVVHVEVASREADILWMACSSVSQRFFCTIVSIT